MAVKNLEGEFSKSPRVAFEVVNPFAQEWPAYLKDTPCVVEGARAYLADFLARNCCGNCIPCREGVRVMHGILERIVSGQGEPKDIDRLAEIIFILEHTASCCPAGAALLGFMSYNLKHFGNEFMNHIIKNVCSTIYVANKRLVIA